MLRVQRNELQVPAGILFFIEEFTHFFPAEIRQVHANFCIFIKHILHATTLLNPGGRLVALCADGPRQREKLKPIAFAWIDLPLGSFKESFTSVAAAVVVIDRK